MKYRAITRVIKLTNTMISDWILSSICIDNDREDGEKEEYEYYHKIYLKYCFRPPQVLTEMNVTCTSPPDCKV